MKKKILVLCAGVLIISQSCKKQEDKKEENPALIKQEVIQNLAQGVIVATYADMYGKAQNLHACVENFNALSTEENLLLARQAWLDMRQAWEQSEGFLFGPVAVNNIDPRIDTWPVNYQSLDSLLAGTTVYTEVFIESLEDGLRGFHPVEYLLFGQNGNKLAADFTSRQKDYMLALIMNLEKLSMHALNDWNNDYLGQFIAPSPSSVYKTQKQVYEEVVNAMSGICDEVANAKIAEPFNQKNPALEESPFANNSLNDFTNNILSVQNIYLGKYSTDGKGLEDFVRLYNLSLDMKIKQQIQNAVTALGNITMPFGEAIISQGTQVQNAMEAINILKETLETELLPLVQLHTN